MNRIGARRRGRSLREAIPPLRVTLRQPAQNGDAGCGSGQNGAAGVGSGWSAGRRGAGRLPGRGVLWRGDGGTTSLEVVLLVPVMMLLALFVLWAGRGGRAALMADLAAEEAATAAALTCEQGKPGCEDLVVDVLSARPGLDFLCIGGPRPRPGKDEILDATWLDRGAAVLDPDGGAVTAENTEVSGVGVLSVSFVCETDGAVAPLRGVFPTVSFRGQASEVAILQGAPKAGLADAEVLEGNPPGTVVLEFTLTLDAPATGEVTLPFTVVGGITADGWATEGVDYLLPVPAEVTVAENATEAAIKVQVVSDVLFEAHEVLELRLEDPVDPADLALINLDPAHRTATGTILNDDDPPAVTVSDAAPVTEGDGPALAFNVTVEASGAVATVSYGTRDGTARADGRCVLDGGAAPDYVAESAALTFGPSSSAQTLPVMVAVGDDLCGEGPETVELWLTAAGAGFAHLADRGGSCGVEADDDPNTGVDESVTTRGDDCAVGVIVDDEPGVEVDDATACETDLSECGNSADTGGQLVFTVRRVGAKTPEVAVRYATIANNAPNVAVADAGADYTPVPDPEAGPCSAGSALVTIAAGGAGTHTVTVPVLDDDLDEHDETLLVELCEPSDNAWISRRLGRGTIVDDDPAPAVTVGDALVDEGAAGAGLRFPVELSAPTGRGEGVTVQFCTEAGAGAGTAAAGDDYTAVACPPSSGGEVRFDAGETGTKYAVVAVSPDVLDEDDETVVLRLDASNAGFADPGGGTGPCMSEVPDDPGTPLVDESDYGDDLCAVGVIVDDDAPPLLRVGDARGTEGATLTFTVGLVSAADTARPVAAQRPVTVDWSVAHVTTTDGDLGRPPEPSATHLTGSVTIAAGHRSTTLEVPTVDDALDEDSQETFTVVLTLPEDALDPAAAVDGDTAGTGTVVDNDDPPAAGVVVCPDAGLALRLDPCPDGVGSYAEEGVPLTFTVRLDAASGRDVVVGWRTVQKTPPAADVATGTALATDAGADYVNAVDTVTIAEGATEGTFEVESVDDAEDEREYELFGVSLDPATGSDPAYSLGTPAAADARIYDNDNLELRLLDGCDRMPASKACVAESTDRAELVVALFDADTGTEVTAPSAVSALYDTALRPSQGEHAAGDGTGGGDPPADFTKVSGGDVRIPAGSSRTTVSVAVADDDLYEYNETFLVRLRARPDANVSIGSEGSAVVTIVDNDDPPRLTVADASAGEGSAVEFALALVPVAGRTVSVDYRTVAAAAAGTEAAAAGTDCAAVPAPDYVAVAATTVSFAPGERTQTATVQTCGDSLDEDDPVDGVGDPLPGDDETFTLKLSDFVGITADAGASPCVAQLGAGTDGDDCAVGRISDDDPRPKLSLEGPAEDVAESAGTATFTARLDNPSGRAVTATVAFGADGDTATRGGDCGSDPPPDYEAAAAGIPVSFAAGDTVFEFSIDVCDDTRDEDDTETLTATIDAGSVHNADLDTGAATAQVRIADDDEVYFEIVDGDDGVGARADEGENLEFTVRLIDAEGRPASSTQTVTVDAATRSGTDNLAAVPHNDVPDGATADYTAISDTTLTFKPDQATSQTVAVAVLADTDTEPEERLQLWLSNPSSNAKLGDYTALGVINGQCHPVLGDLSPPRLIVRSDVSGTEGETLTHRIDLDPAVCEPGLEIRFLGHGDCAPRRTGARLAACEAVGGGPGLALASSEDFTGGRPGTSASSIGNGITRASSLDYDTFDDDIDEPDEFYRIMHEIYPGGRLNPAQWHGESTVWSVGTIIDNDTSEIGVAAAEATEGDDGHTVAVFTLTLSTPNSRDVAVDFTPVATPSAAAPATAGADCTGDADFITGSHATTIPAGDTSHLAAIRFCGDTDTEPDETLQVRIDSAKALTPGRQDGEALSIAVRGAEITILNDDGDDCVDPTDDSSAVPPISINNPTAAESDGSITFTVSIPTEVCENKQLAVRYRTIQDRTATAGRDYRASQGRAEIPAGERSVDLEVELIDDNEAESTETFAFGAHWASGQPYRYTRVGEVTGRGTVTDDDGVLVEVSDAGPVAEGTDLQFTVSLVDADGAPATSSTAVGVDYHTRDLTATAGADYTGVPASSPRRLTFASGQRSRTVSVPTLADSVEEADERLQLRLANPSGHARIRGPGIGVGAIRGDCVDPGDARQGRPEASFGPLRVSEDAGTVPFELDIGCATVAATWRLEFSGVTARVAPESTDVGAGYTFTDNDRADAAAADRLETFAAAAPARIRGRIAVNDDDLDEPDETLRVRAVWVGDLPAHWTSRHWDFTLAIADDDDPEITAFNDVTVQEGDGNAVLAIELGTAPAEPVSVKYTTVAQTPGSSKATSGSDYTHTERTHTIPAGSRRSTIEVPIIDDSDVEQNETFLVGLSEPSGGLRLDPDTTAQVTIVDNDRCIDPTVEGPPAWRAATGFPQDHNYSQYGAAVEGDRVLFGFETDRPLCRAVYYRWAYTGTGTADENDFRTGAGSGSARPFSWPGSSSPTVGTFGFNTFEDNEIEVTETFGVRVYWCSPASSSLCSRNDGVLSSWYGEELRMQGSIIDDDDPEVTVANVEAVEVAEDAGEMVFVMELDPPPKSQAVVRYRTAATPSAGDRAATRDLDYTHTEGRLTIPVGSGRARIRVPVVDDRIEERDETFLLRLQAVSGLRMADPWAQGTILDDDAPEPDMSLAGPDPDGVFEGADMAFTVSLSEPATRRITVGYRTVDGTATAGADYTGEAGTLTFRPGDTAQTVTVSTIDDGAATGAVRFGFELHGEFRGRVVGARRVTAVIYDDERPPAVTLSAADASAREGDPLEFAVTLDAPSPRAVTLPYRTVDGTATAGADYTARAASLVVGAGDRSGTISVPTRRDPDAAEGDETVSLTFGTAVNARGPGRAATGTIRDGPALGTPEISVSDAAGVREGLDLSFTVTADPAPASAVTVQYRTVDGTATAGADYTANFGRVTFAAGDTSKTVAVATIDDGVNEVDETLRLELARVVSGDAVIAVAGDGVGTIIGEKATISVHDATVDEEDDSSRDEEVLGGHLTVRLDRALEVDLPFGLAFRSDTALLGYRGAGHNPFSDFFTRCLSTVPAGETLYRCEIVTQDDGRYEGTETAEIVLTLSSARICDALDRQDCVVPADHAVIGDGTATLSITEDEAPPAIKAIDATVDEGSTLTLDLRLEGNNSDRTITLDWATENGAGAGAATAPRHYVAGSGTVTFLPADDVNPDGVRLQAIRIKTRPNSARDGDKVFYVRLSRPHHATLWGDTDNDGEVLVKITIDDDD